MAACESTTSQSPSDASTRHTSSSLISLFVISGVDVTPTDSKHRSPRERDIASAQPSSACWTSIRPPTS
eukprot:7389068-Prymnesium_polylepis.1